MVHSSALKVSEFLVDLLGFMYAPKSTDPETTQCDWPYAEVMQNSMDLGMPFDARLKTC